MTEPKPSVSQSLRAALAALDNNDAKVARELIEYALIAIQHQRCIAQAALDEF